MKQAETQYGKFFYSDNDWVGTSPVYLLAD